MVCKESITYPYLFQSSIYGGFRYMSYFSYIIVKWRFNIDFFFVCEEFVTYLYLFQSIYLFEVMFLLFVSGLWGNCRTSSWVIVSKYFLLSFSFLLPFDLSFFLLMMFSFHDLFFSVLIVFHNSNHLIFSLFLLTFPSFYFLFLLSCVFSPSFFLLLMFSFYVLFSSILFILYNSNHVIFSLFLSFSFLFIPF